MSETEKSQKLMARAFRWPKYGMAERLVARHLFTASCTNNKSSILQNVCRAAMKVETLLKEDQKIEGVDFDLLRGIYTIDSCLNNPQIIKFDCVYEYRVGWVCKECYRIHWNFETMGTQGKANFEKLAKPWFKKVSCWEKFLTLPKEARITVVCKKCGLTLLDLAEKKLKQNNKSVVELLKEKYGEQKTKKVKLRINDFTLNMSGVFYKRKKVKHWVFTCPKCKEKKKLEDFYSSEKKQVLKSNPSWKFAFEVTWYLKKAGWHQLLNSFYNWSVQVCEDATIKLSQLISPETLKDIERLMAAQQPQEEKTESENLLETR